MQRALVVVAIVALILMAGLAWHATAQLGGRETSAPATAPSSVPTAGKIDLNRATVEELSRLPGISPQAAEWLVRNRPYRNLDDVVVRRILGKKQFARIRELVTVGHDGR